MLKLSREVALFAVGGIGGLLVDAAVVQSLVSAMGWNPYLARVLSFLLAATFTWWWNRNHTFAGHRSERAMHAEWLHWMGLMSIGAVINYGVYVLLLLCFSGLHRWPALAAAAGSAVAALVNFSTARGVLFKRPKTSP
ncbi:MAG: GtrA family protein [Rhodanobacter sp.]